MAEVSRSRLDADEAAASVPATSAEDAASLIAAGAAMGMLVPPAIFMIVIAVVTNTSRGRAVSGRLHSGRDDGGVPLRRWC